MRHRRRAESSTCGSEGEQRVGNVECERCSAGAMVILNAAAEGEGGGCVSRRSRLKSKMLARACIVTGTHAHEGPGPPGPRGVSQMTELLKTD